MSHEDATVSHMVYNPQSTVLMECYNLRLSKLPSVSVLVDYLSIDIVAIAISPSGPLLDFIYKSSCFQRSLRFLAECFTRIIFVCPVALLDLV